MDGSRSEEILHYWFGDVAASDSMPPPDRQELWFGRSEGTDYFIRQLFEADLTAARAGDLEEWKQAARPSLAWILLMDQFSRHIYRNFPAAYEGDVACQIQTLEGIEAGLDRELGWFERAFYYMPMQHAEDLEVQERGVELFADLAEQVPAALRARFREFRDFAVRHRDVIQRFGRFPHRNEILGRESSPEEVEFLTLPGSRF